jgi:hypothetical protein
MYRNFSESPGILKTLKYQFIMFSLKSSLKVKLEQPCITGKSRKNKHKELSSLFLIIAVWDILEDGKRTLEEI